MSQKIAAVRETLREERQYLADRVSPVSYTHLDVYKRQVHISLFFHQELPLPFQRFSLGGKAALELLLAFTLPIGVAELNIPGAIVLSLIHI